MVFPKVPQSSQTESYQLSHASVPEELRPRQKMILLPPMRTWMTRTMHVALTKVTWLNWFGDRGYWVLIVEGLTGFLKEANGGKE